MNDQNKKELQELLEKIEKSERFAERVPVLADEILRYKYTGDELAIDFGYVSGYNGIKSIYRNYFKEIELYNPTKNIKDKVLFRIYFYRERVPTIYDNYGLDELGKDNTVFHFDWANDTFYIEEQNLDRFLNKFDVWYKQMLIKSKIDKATVEIKHWEKVKKENEELLKEREEKE